MTQTPPGLDFRALYSMASPENQFSRTHRSRTLSRQSKPFTEHKVPPLRLSSLRDEKLRTGCQFVEDLVQSAGNTFSTLKLRAEILRWESFASERLRVLRMTILSKMASGRLWWRGTLLVWRGGGARLRGSVRILRSCGGVRGRSCAYLARRRWAGCTRRLRELHRRR